MFNWIKSMFGKRHVRRELNPYEKEVIKNLASTMEARWTEKEPKMPNMQNVSYNTGVLGDLKDSLTRRNPSYKPLFAIVNCVDRPCAKLVAMWVDGVGYCYLSQNTEEHKHLKSHNGMDPARPQSIESFGFEVLEQVNQYVFVKVRDSVATYPDGKRRDWDSDETIFTLPKMKSTDEGDPLA